MAIATWQMTPSGQISIRNLYRLGKDCELLGICRLERNNRKNGLVAPNYEERIPANGKYQQFASINLEEAMPRLPTTTPILSTFLVAALMFSAVQIAAGDILVDFSPDATGASNDADYFNTFFSFEQTLGDRFTVFDPVKISAGSLYSPAGNALVGDSVSFLIFEEVSGEPASVPLFNIATTIDLIDTEGTTSQPSLVRQRASIGGIRLEPGTYYFSMPGITADHIASLGIYDDDTVWVGFDSNPDLEAGSFSGIGGDLFMRIEGEVVPEPVVSLLLTMMLMGIACVRQRSGVRTCI